jgi:predicted nucleic acid-binding protein
VNTKSEDIVKKLVDYFPDEWKELMGDPEKTKDMISQLARELPPKVYEVVRDELISKLLEIGKSSVAMLQFVVDANIIVADAFRVGKGKYSSTERIFSSIFVKLYAPKSIVEEVFTQIKTDLPKGCSLDAANKHATKLLAKIELIDDSKLEVEYAELPKFKEKFGNDVSFLRVAVGLGVKNVISWDKAFDEPTVVERFEMGGAVSMIVSVESGALSISIVGGAAYIGGKGIYWLLLLLYKVLAQIFAFIAMAVSGGVACLVSAMGNAPGWVWYIVFGALIGTGIAFALSKDLRKQAVEKATDLYDWLANKSKFVLEVMTNLLKGAVDVAVVFKDELGPYFVNVGLAMMMTIAEMNDVLSPESS